MGFWLHTRCCKAKAEKDDNILFHFKQHPGPVLAFRRIPDVKHIASSMSIRHAGKIQHAAVRLRNPLRIVNVVPIQNHSVASSGTGGVCQAWSTRNIEMLDIPNRSRRPSWLPRNATLQRLDPKGIHDVGHQPKTNDLDGSLSRHTSCFVTHLHSSACLAMAGLSWVLSLRGYRTPHALGLRSPGIQMQPKHE